MTDTLAGQTINGRYKLIRQLGLGGMGLVYLARQENLDRDVAIKLMHPFLSTDKGFLQRFRREAKAMAALNHPHIVKIHDFGTYGNRGITIYGRKLPSA